MENNEYETNNTHDRAFKNKFNALTAMSELIVLLRKRGRNIEAYEIADKHYKLYQEMR